MNERAQPRMTIVPEACEHAVSLLRSSSRNSWGANEDSLRMLVNGLVTFKLTYGCNDLSLNRSHAAVLQRINRKAKKIVSGLPKTARIDYLYTKSVSWHP